MKHLKTFESESAFDATKDKLIEPWVALVSDKVAYSSDNMGMPTTEIWYTSTDSEIITPTTFNTAPWGDGVTMISNTYENGKGVMKFDGDVTRIGPNAPVFYTERLLTIEIPNSVTSIGDFAFSACSSHTSIEIPNSVTSIGNQAFSACSSLTSIEIPNSVTSIGEGAFGSCSGLTSIEIPNSVTSIGQGAFSQCSGLTSINIPNSVTSIENGTFYSCSGLTSVEIPNSVTSIGNQAFSACSSLTSIEIPNSITSIGDGAFGSCSGLTSIEIPNSVTSIGQGAFGVCTNLTSVTLPNRLTDFGINQPIFWDCQKLSDVYCDSVNEPCTISASMLQAGGVTSMTLHVKKGGSKETYPTWTNAKNLGYSVNVNVVDDL